MKKILVIILCILSFTGCETLNLIKGEMSDKLYNEKGDLVPSNNFRSVETENYRITWCGFETVTSGKEEKINFNFSFVINHPEDKIEYVKVESVVPGDVLTFIDETKNNNDKKWDTNIVNINGKTVWNGVAYGINGIFTPKSFHKSVIKFTIKSMNKEEEVIYQPVKLPVFYWNQQ